MKNFTALLSGLLLGAIIGASIATLLAPKSGEDLRTDIRQRIQSIQDEVKQAGQERRAELERQLADLRAPRRLGTPQ